MRISDWSSDVCSSDLVLVARDGGVGHIRLNRPKAIHALTHGMVKAITDALLEWRSDDAIVAVMIDHAEGRGFCAGGDKIGRRRVGKECVSTCRSRGSPYH